MDDCCLRRQIRNDTQGQFVTIQTFLLPVGSTKCHFLATTALWHNQRMLVADFAPQWFGPMTRHKKNSGHIISRNDISYNWAAAGENWSRRYAFSICKWGESFTTHTLCSTYTTYIPSPVFQVLDFETAHRDDLWRSRSSLFHLAYLVLCYYSLQYSQEMLVADFIPTCLGPNTWQGISVRRGVWTERISIDPMCRSLTTVCQMGESKAKYVLTLYPERYAAD